MASDELRIILEVVKEKFDLVIEAVNMTNERMHRNEKAVEERFDKLDTEILLIKKDIREMKVEAQGMKGDIQEMKGDIRDLRQDLNDHRSNTELHGSRSSKKVS
jgi:peptidoglycan hydrolase CwlO-like protein